MQDLHSDMFDENELIEVETGTDYKTGDITTMTTDKLHVPTQFSIQNDAPFLHLLAETEDLGDETAQKIADETQQLLLELAVGTSE